MEKVISAADANRQFSRLLRDVKQGQSYVVTSHGRPVARLAPVTGDRSASTAKASLMARLKSQKVTNVGRWNREDLYDI
ncbi:MAG TPA: type II toxin-antitoxin system prevent-host-death family antitoxin [Terriglobales bacterium]|jgi:prevent-host-death family protein|nr:type II toxin-antitoxin system prevent-host-death family antitoxin [Terriglobales bacterium]